MMGGSSALTLVVCVFWATALPAGAQHFNRPGWMQAANHPAGQFGGANIHELPPTALDPARKPTAGGRNGPAAPFDTPVDAIVDGDARLLSQLRRRQAVESGWSRWLKATGEHLSRPEVQLQWFCTAVACLCVVMCGILPVVLLPIETGAALHSPAGLRHLNLLLSFAVGSLLGDVFLHLLPEAWACENSDLTTTGFWILAGLLACFLVEKSCAYSEESQHTVCAVMNLIANVVDNFTHGLAVGGSFLVSTRFGILTTFAILIHEVPHEISDFAILLRADYDRWSAVKAQLLTALGGVLGATVALAGGEGAAASSWILPFTAGGFLNIALVQVLPDLIQERDPRESLKQMAMILFGIAVMGGLNSLHFE